MAWDPDRYLRFADHRSRPGLELMARIRDIEPHTVVDLGCGTGDLTAHLANRWPDAHVLGIDASQEMIDRARLDHPDLTWRVGDIGSWQPREPVDFLYSNAALHWLDEHQDLFRRLRSSIAPGGVMAIQMPDNWNAPTHRIPADILDEGDWTNAARSALMRDRLDAPDAYARWVQPANVDVWRTTYYQHLLGEEPIWTWVTGSVLRPVLAALDGTDRIRFEAECRSRYLTAYPPDSEGVTVLPFSRLFIVVNVP